jgi:hypothetical protein
MPYVVLNKYRLLTDCYSNIETVTTGEMGKSRREFGVFTDTGKLPAHSVKSP